MLLAPALATPFSLVLHELAVNAAKHGALSVAKVRIEVTWAVASPDGGNRLALVWRESDGLAIVDIQKAGSGSALLKQAIPGATVRRAFETTGLVCTIEVRVQEARK